MRNVMWSPPPPGFLKLNVDGGAKGKPGPAGCGGVVRDSSSNIRFILSKPLRTKDSIEVEILAIKFGLHFFHNANIQGASGLLIESDSSTAVSWCKDANNRLWKLWRTFDEIDGFLNSINNVSYIIIFREANGLAGSLAKAGLARHCFFFMHW